MSTLPSEAVRTEVVRAEVMPPDAVPSDVDLLAMSHALTHASANVAEGGGPFGAVIVTPAGALIGAANRVVATNDPTAHAEVEAIREACRQLGTFNLSGCILYSSCEPCPMCLMACQWARLDRVWYAATAEDAARAGFDDLAFYRALRGESALPTPVGHLPHPEHLAPFERWAAYAPRVPY